MFLMINSLQLEKGLDTLIHYSQLRNNKDLEEELTKMKTVTVHVA